VTDASQAAAIADPLLRRLMAYWESKRAGRFAPARADIDPVDFPWILADLALAEVVGDPPRYRYRLISQQLIEYSGINLTGRFLDEMSLPEFRERVARTYGEVLATRRPTHGSREAVFDGRMRRYNYLILPLSNDGERVDMLLVALRSAA
jgi:hypothetical protein